MAEVKSASDYVSIATLFSDENMEVSVTFKGEKTVDNFYILNKFLFSEKDLDIFKKLFSFFSSPKKTKDFVDFFVHKDNFYAAFKYVHAENIKQKYNKHLNTAVFDERCFILENILIKIDQLYKITPEILACVTEPENICVDGEKNVHLIYNLKNIEKYKKDSRKAIFENIYDIIFIMLQQEAQAPFNKALHIVLDKCKRGVYSSIPELVIELKKAEKISKTSSWWSYFKYQLSLRQKLINKLTQTTITAAIIVGLLYLGYMKINENKTPTGAAPVVSIGDVSYNANAEDESAKNVSTEKENTTKTNKVTSDIVLMEGLDMDFEDYIVQHGDTIASICEAYYKDASFITAVATFNGLQTNEKLVPGSILKLPNRTAIALYVSR